MTDFHPHFARQCAVSREKFGPNERRKGVIAHIEQELEEIQEAQTQARHSRLDAAPRV